jgi:hypothetical protein
MYTLTWDPDGSKTTVSTWSEVVTFLTTLTIPCKSISLLTSKTRAACEIRPEQVLVLMDGTGAVTTTLMLSYSPNPIYSPDPVRPTKS